MIDKLEVVKETETMAFDFKKEYKEFYMPKNKPQIVNVPKMNYIAVRGKGNPNERVEHTSRQLVCYMRSHILLK